MIADTKSAWPIYDRDDAPVDTRFPKVDQQRETRDDGRQEEGQEDHVFQQPRSATGRPGVHEERRGRCKNRCSRNRETTNEEAVQECAAERLVAEQLLVPGQRERVPSNLAATHGEEGEDEHEQDRQVQRHVDKHGDNRQRQAHDAALHRCHRGLLRRRAA